MIRNATDLTPAEKTDVETLLGRSVQDGEAVSVRTFMSGGRVGDEWGTA